jgi:hypothetical protein
MKRYGLIFYILLVGMTAIVACGPIDDHHPWKDDAGVLHTTPHDCGRHPVTHDITIMYDDDSYSESKMTYKSSSNSNFYLKNRKSKKYSNYSFSRKNNHTYLTYPVQTDEYYCLYS